MKRLLGVFVLSLTMLLGVMAYFHGSEAQAQQLPSNSRVGNVVTTHTTVGTATADAIADASVGGGMLQWKICNDAVNTSTYLLVGEAVDVSTDGVMIGPGSCFVCPYCTPQTLKDIRVEGQAAANGYSVIQYRQ